MSLPLYAISIGELVIIGIPEEPFCSTSLELKASLNDKILVVGYASGYYGYFLTEDALAYGGYESKDLWWVDSRAASEIARGYLGRKALI